MTLLGRNAAFASLPAKKSNPPPTQKYSNYRANSQKSGSAMANCGLFLGFSCSMLDAARTTQQS
jgi:hypothetical protein